MKKQKALKILLWAAVLATAAAIFMFSCEDSGQSNDTSGRFLSFILGLLPSFRAMPALARAQMEEAIMYIVRKCAHFCIYAVLGFFLVLLNKQYRSKNLIGIPVLASFLYAITDEIHQRFVPGRYGCARDVFIDTCGALAGACFAWLLVFIWDKLRKYRKKTV